jgi:NodT family efflux transporter outer membrane factor (OMF) lipoprotein
MDYAPPPATTLLSTSAWQAALPHEGSKRALLDWWKTFNDPVLDTLLQRAETHSPTLAAAVARIDEARAGMTISAAGGKPALQASAHLLRNNGSADFPVAAQTTRGSVLDAQWEIDLFGRVRRGNEAATARLESSEQVWHAARISLAAEVASRYVSYRACQLMRHALVKDAKSRAETSRLTVLAAQAGVTAPVDAELARASSAEIQAALVAQESGCDITRKSLVSLTGIAETELLSLLQSPSDANNLPMPAAFQVDSLPAALLAQRPDLAAAERELAASRADVGVATANRYPRLALIGNLTRNRSGESPSYLSKPWLFGPSLSLPLLDGGALAAQQNAATARYEKTLADYRQAVLNAVEEVETALVRLDATQRQADNAHTARLGYQAYFQAAEKNWRVGGLSLLALEDARRALNAAERNEIALQRDRVLHWVALYKALGGAWSTPDRATPVPPSLPADRPAGASS